MKLRIKGNSIRLRLTQSEVNEIGEGKVVTETVPFGEMYPRLHYCMGTFENLEDIEVCFEDYEVRINVPKEKALEWVSSEVVGMETTLTFSEEETLHVLIEKDFQCLHKRPNEDEKDNFPNPAMKS